MATKVRPRHISKEEAAAWNAVADALKEASDKLEAAALAALTNLSARDFERVLDRIKPAEEALSGLAYMCRPQTEWLGGDSKTNAYAIRPPHIVPVIEEIKE